MTVRDISDHLSDLYEVEIGRDTISQKRLIRGLTAATEELLEISSSV